MAKTDYYRNRLLDAELRGQTLTFPATWYLAAYLIGAPPTAAGGGTEVSGPSVTTGYQRVAIANSIALWLPTQGVAGAGQVSSGNTGRVSNAGGVTFPQPTANVGTVGFLALFDAFTNGNMWRTFQLATPYVWNSGNSALVIGADALAVYEA